VGGLEINRYFKRLLEARGHVGIRASDRVARDMRERHAHVALDLLSTAKNCNLCNFCCSVNGAAWRQLFFS